FLLLPETNMFAETNQLLTQNGSTSSSNTNNIATQENQIPDARISQDVQSDDEQNVSVLREVAHSNPVTKYIMDRCIVPVFMSP
ncbi:MAG: hypothetical protein Q4G59_11995, partial [Planctomycetia bacterium]|nr:hypothetical protein [Planctomycetia bacterium]